MRRGVLALAAALCLGFVAAACSPITSLFHTRDALHNAGYQSVSLKLPENTNSDNLGVSVSVEALPVPSTAENVASIVWHHFGERFDQLNVTVHGQGETLHESYSFDQMQSLFGPRSSGMDRTTLSSALTRLGLGVVIGFVALVALVVVVAVLVTRGRRRRTTGPRGSQPWGGPPPAWPSGGPPSWGASPHSGGWGSPPPATPVAPVGSQPPGWGPAPAWVSAPQAATPPSGPPLWPAPTDPPRSEESAPSPGAGAAADTGNAP
jgi:hypothetical protein